ncbi:NAD(P)-dependent oxidoreductase [Oceanobacillus sp. HCA-5259]|uniref:NAD-dependent epimerase/dehydratase family protein n=1 Tax=Oceanobacillus sp. HCA-5259 TaxID=3134661 RepID=UPI0030C11A8F
MSENKTILVSGASGFLGKELVKQLLEGTDYRVIAITSNKDKLLSRFKQSNNLLILNRSTWLEEIPEDTNIDILVNCAFPRSSEPEKLARGLDFTEQFIRETIELNIKKIINISSQSVYSQKEKSSTDETTPVKPESLYGMTKYATERIVASLCESSSQNINYSNIRLASLTGIELEVRMTNRFVRQALEGKPIIVNGGSQKVSYLEVRDAAAALITMINTDSSIWKPVYNLGNFDHLSVLSIAKTVKEEAKNYSVKNVNIEVKGDSSDFNNLVNTDLFNWEFQWEPRYTIPLMVKDLFEHYTADE